MSNIWECEYYYRCLSNTKCALCGPNQRLLKLPEDKITEKNRQRLKTGYKKTSVKTEASWEELEQHSANILNAVPTFREAKRTIRSGALWFQPGDVIDEKLLLECKERGTVTAKGEKTFSILKNVLDKVIEEAKSSHRFPGLVFRYKDDSESYVVQPFNDLIHLVHLIKAYETEIDMLQKENEFLKKRVD